MKQISSQLQTLLSGPQGISPIIVLEIKWSSADDPIYYSTIEHTIDGAPVYAYVLETGDISNLTRADGFGTNDEIIVTFKDPLGHFKQIYDEKDLNTLDSYANVYLSAEGIENKGHMMLLFNGKVADPIDWSEGLRTFSVKITQNSEISPIGFIPNADIDVMNPLHDDYVDEGTTPTDPNYTMLKENFNQQMWPHIFNEVKNYTPVRVANNPKTTTVGNVEYSGSGGLPDFQVEDYSSFPLNTVIKVRISRVKEVYTSAIMEGQFMDVGGGVIKFRPTDFNIYLYENLTIDHTGAKKYELTDDPTNPPWLKGLFVKLQEVEYESEEDEEGTVISERNSYIVEQEGNVIYGAGSMALVYRNGLPGFFVVPRWNRIAAVQGWWGDAWPHGSDGWEVEQGTEFALYGWDLANTYIIDARAGTTVTDLTSIGEYGKSSFPTGSYNILSTDGTDANKLWEPSHPPCTYAVLEDNAFLRVLPDEVGLKEAPREGTILASATNNLTTDSAIANYIIEEYSNYTGGSPSVPKTCSFIIKETEDVESMIADLAWQTGKIIRINNGVISLIDITEEVDALFNFSKSNIFFRSVKVGYTPRSDLKTILDVTVQKYDFNVPPKRFIRRNNISSYGNKRLDVVLDVLKNNSDIITITDYWLNKISNIWKVVSFKTGLASVGLELYDTIDLDLSLELSYYDTTDGVPIENVLTGDSGDKTLLMDEAVKGFVLSKVINLSGGTIDYNVLVPIKIGTKVRDNSFYVVP